MGAIRWATCAAALVASLIVVVADVCTEGCNLMPVACTCDQPFFTCNTKAGTCVFDSCDGECQMATWLIAVLATIGGLSVIGCLWCCCFRPSSTAAQPAPAGVSVAVGMAGPTNQYNMRTPMLAAESTVAGAPTAAELEFEEFQRFKRMQAAKGGPGSNPAGYPTR